MIQIYIHAIKITNEIENPSWCGASRRGFSGNKVPKKKERNADEKWRWQNSCIAPIRYTSLVVLITHLFTLHSFKMEMEIKLKTVKIEKCEERRHGNAMWREKERPEPDQSKHKNSICIDLRLQANGNIYFLFITIFIIYRNKATDRHVHKHTLARALATVYAKLNVKAVNGYDYDDTHMYSYIRSIFNTSNTDI